MAHTLRDKPTNQFLQIEGSHNNLRLWMILIALIVILNLITAIYSVGFYHPDEHFQILEFLSTKLPPNPFGQSPYLAWEYEARIRPWFQIFIYYCVTLPLYWIGWSERWQIALGMRVSTAILALIGTALLAQGIIHHKKKPPRDYTLLLSLVLGFSYFVPFFNCRTSSESMGGIFAAAALGLYLWKVAPTDDSAHDGSTAPYDPQTSTKKPSTTFFISVLVGLLWGFAFDARYQIAFAILGFGLWHLVYCPKPWGKALTMSVGFGVAFALGVLADHWGYGVWQFTPWKYFQSNILQGKAAEFGTSPWYDWFVMYFTKHFQPVVGVTFALVLVGAMARPKSLLAWCAGAFFIGHLTISHKEDRFLFPLYLVGLPLACDLIYDVVRPFLQSLQPRLALRMGQILFALNGLGLIYLASSPAELPLEAAAKLEHEAYNYPSSKPPLYFVRSHPLRAVNVLPMHFFAPYDQIKATEIPSIEDQQTALFQKERPFFLYVSSRGCPASDTPITAHGCRLVSRVPRIFSYFHWNGGFCKAFDTHDRSDLFVCEEPSSDPREAPSVATRPTRP